VQAPSFLADALLKREDKELVDNFLTGRKEIKLNL
jgi:hypothetical protein